MGVTGDTPGETGIKNLKTCAYQRTIKYIYLPFLASVDMLAITDLNARGKPIGHKACQK
jgi:hypothetical protein